MGAFDFFWTTWRSLKHRKGLSHDEFWSARGGFGERLELPDDTTLDGALEAARRAGAFGRGSSQTGCFEVQGPRGIWTHRQGLRNLGRARPDDVVFKTWEQLEREDDAEAAVGVAGCLFILGTTVLPWLWQPGSGGPLMVNANVLADRRTPFPRGQVELYIDSAGFSEITGHGQHRRTAEGYGALVRRCRDELGTLVWASCQDWVCTPRGLAASGLSLAEHQRRTAESFVALRKLDPTIEWVPVLQGQDPEHYLAHEALYREAGVALEELPAIGVGSLVGRSVAETRRILEAVDLPGLHGFGVKGLQLRDVAHLLATADSMAWCADARWRARRAREAQSSGQTTLAGMAPPQGGMQLIRSRAYAERWRAKQVAMAAGGRRGAG
jgi:hypothetical protein